MYALGYASGQGSDLDQSGDQLVKLLLELRVVLLQDSALPMPRFPKLPLDWSRFAEQVREAEAREEEPEHVLLARTQPLDLKSYLVAAINALTQQIAQNQAPQRLLLVPPEAAKESFLNESFGDILSSTALTSRSPPARRPASDAPPATVAPGPSPTSRRIDPITPSMKSMAEVWQEWHHGGNPSVVELDKRFGNKWRCNSKIRQRCSIRKRLAAKEEASRRGVPVEDVISLMDKIKASDGHRLSPDKISRLLSGNDKQSLSSLL
ncbi:hypothetical protein V8E54_007050 [Elaphomyces granulatus]